MNLTDFCEIGVPKPKIETRTVYGEQFQNEGVVILKNFMPEKLIDDYKQAFSEANKTDAQKAVGFGIGTPYMAVEQIRALCLYRPFMQVLNNLFLDAEEMMMHLNLTGWKSTERNWHQDDYLNPPFVNGHYAGVWFALDDIDPDAGPFEYVPGSHNHLEVCRGEKIRSALPSEKANNSSWPKFSEEILNELYEAEIKKNNWEVKSWAGKKGDVLIWHGFLLHRGSKPKNPELFRPTIITHYSATNYRHDMQSRQRYINNIYNSEGLFFKT